MPATIAWLNHDAEEQERVTRILALFQEQGTQDNLGFGGIRDAFADRLFPGTSTVQTRLRYFFFIPWMYRHLEAKRTPARKIAAAAREFELALVTPLLSSEEAGIFGRRSRGGLARLPSDVYWGGLHAWGIRLYPYSQAAYHRSVDAIYAQRAARRRDGSEFVDDPLATWHPAIPDPPERFPHAATIHLRRHEAAFLQERIIASHPRSLLAYLATHPRHTDVTHAWEHPDYGAFHPGHQQVLNHARIFSDVAQGAAILYNLLVAQEAGSAEKIEALSDRLDRWHAEADREAIHSWDLDQLWELTLGQGHSISIRTREFVGRWLDAVRRDSFRDDPAVHGRIRDREISLKRARSKFLNARAREEQWSGEAGLDRMSFRWPSAQRLLNDLFDGLAHAVA